MNWQPKIKHWISYFVQHLRNWSRPVSWTKFIAYSSEFRPHQRPIQRDWFNSFYRRRPKGRMTTCQSATILNEMADRIGTSGSGSGGALLPEDAIQYLQLIDAADKVNNAPNFIDSNAWQILCKMRRSKIENEFRVIDSKINVVIVGAQGRRPLIPE